MCTQAQAHTHALVRARAHTQELGDTEKLVLPAFTFSSLNPDEFKQVQPLRRAAPRSAAQHGTAQHSSVAVAGGRWPVASGQL